MFDAVVPVSLIFLGLMSNTVPAGTLAMTTLVVSSCACMFRLPAVPTYILRPANVRIVVSEGVTSCNDVDAPRSAFGILTLLLSAYINFNKANIQNCLNMQIIIVCCN